LLSLFLEFSIKMSLEDLGSLRLLIAQLEQRLQRIEAGQMDDVLDHLVQQPIPAEYRGLLNRLGCRIPAPPSYLLASSSSSSALQSSATGNSVEATAQSSQSTTMQNITGGNRQAVSTNSVNGQTESTTNVGEIKSGGTSSLTQTSAPTGVVNNLRTAPASIAHPAAAASMAGSGLSSSALNITGVVGSTGAANIVNSAPMPPEKVVAATPTATIGVPPPALGSSSGTAANVPGTSSTPVPNTGASAVLGSGNGFSVSSYPLQSQPQQQSNQHVKEGTNGNGGSVLHPTVPAAASNVAVASTDGSRLGLAVDGSNVSKSPADLGEI
jgi:hypothetical protein